MPITLDGTNGITTPMYNGSITANAVTPSVNMKNRIINGNMTISQRNGTSSVTITNTGAFTYTLDRWATIGSAASKFSVQQDAGAITPPVGFTDYLGTTSLSAYTVGASESFRVIQCIEGFNTADLMWGTANAKTVTLSFWVRSSLTGTFGGSIRNENGDRFYPYSYTISSANTWEQKSITIAGDTTGTWATTNGNGIQVQWSLGAGSTVSGTAGAWSGSTLQSVTGATSVVGTNGATFYITGVQLEVGSTATSFDYRPYGTELALCQRYYYKIFPAESSKAYGNGTSVDTTTMYNTVPSPVTMRVNPTLQTTGTASDYAIVRGGGTNTTCNSVPVISDQSTQFVLQVIGTLASGLSTGSSGWLRTASASSFLAFSAEL
jgi:hypothetical protein